MISLLLRSRRYFLIKGTLLIVLSLLCYECKEVTFYLMHILCGMCILSSIYIIFLIVGNDKNIAVYEVLTLMYSTLTIPIIAFFLYWQHPYYYWYVNWKAISLFLILQLMPQCAYLCATFRKFSSVQWITMFILTLFTMIITISVLPNINWHFYETTLLYIGIYNVAIYYCLHRYTRQPSKIVLTGKKTVHYCLRLLAWHKVQKKEKNRGVILKTILFYLITIIATIEINRILCLDYLRKMHETSAGSSLYTALVKNYQFNLTAFLIQIAPLIANFLIFWVLRKVMCKSAKFIPLLLSLITILLSFFIFLTDLNWYIEQYFTPFIGFYISIFIINFTLFGKSSALADSLCLLISFLSFHFLSKLFSSLLFGIKFSAWYFPYNYVDLILFFISLIASIIYFYTETKKMGTASTASVPTVPDHPKTVVVTCPTCKTDYEVQQQTCPGCGYPFAGTEKEKAVFIAQQILKKGHLAGAKKRITAARVILWIIGGLNIIFASSDTVSLVTGILFILCGFWTYKKPVISISISLIILIISYAPPEILLTPYIPFAGLLWKVILLITFIIALVSAVKAEKIKKESKFLQSQK